MREILRGAVMAGAILMIGGMFWGIVIAGAMLSVPALR